MWLTTVISVLFLGLAGWRYAHPGDTKVTKDSAYFNAVNFALFGLLGLFCVLWPRRKEDETSTGEKRSLLGAAGAAGQRRDEGGAPAAGIEVVVVDDAQPAVKREVIYLTNMKTFLTFVVVTHHTMCMFFNEGQGIQTLIIDPANQKPFVTITQWILSINQSYFMAAFFLISGYFCPKSLDRKGFRAFVADKIVRLGGPFLLWSTLVGPLADLFEQAYAGVDRHYRYDPGVCWFILWLLNFSIAYAVVAQFTPKVKLGMPHPFVLLVIGMGLGGGFYGLSKKFGAQAFGTGGKWNNLGGMNMWTYGIAMYIPFFAAGVLGGRNDWLKSVEEMKTWVVWTLRVITVGFWGLYFVAVGKFTIPIKNLHIDVILASQLAPPAFAVVMTLAMIQLFHQHFNASPQSKLVRNAGASAYIVYVIQFLPLNVVMITLIEILKAAGTHIVFKGMVFLTIKDDGNIAALSESSVWYGWAFLFVVGQIVCWPLGFYVRKLPILNKMF
ncbi:putative acyltransferase [Chloropicon primus]|uniref:Acyltransferase 3 domain-containing protein n=1 Tax=Chloropicon primus TaxID=1764295 RepID=A0A5B8MZQ8_9CHLO|nr:hypothetical protein A3770_16p76900 [Chloropicon primus]UPR04377.1 putative acyltransferase [Chloropicon primus]|eukprot:QDZ25172.1 hypothetical protein A3770_16p76900 [Chloropicon primus]